MSAAGQSEQTRIVDQKDLVQEMLIDYNVDCDMHFELSKVYRLSRTV